MHPLELSTKVIDSGVVDHPINRVTNELSELAPDLAIVESFSHSVAWDCGDGVVCFDASGVGSGKAVIQSIREWRSHPINTLVYTHGHADHVGGSGAFAADAESRGHARPHVIGHEKVRDRLDRYTATSDWNLIINQRQFGGISSDMGLHIGSSAQSFLPLNTLRPDEVFQSMHSFTAGNSSVELHHARGETDDHLWAWFPQKKWLFSGDFVIWNFPNAGNPQKVQRYAMEWAQALRRMIAQGPELLEQGVIGHWIEVVAAGMSDHGHAAGAPDPAHCLFERGPTMRHIAGLALDEVLPKNRRHVAADTAVDDVTGKVGA